MDWLYNWYNEPKNQTVCLNPEFLSKLTLSLINKINVDSQEKKIEELKKYGFAKSSIKKWLYCYSKGGIEIKNLIKICDFLKISYENINDKFLGIGQSGKASRIKTLSEPNFPINLNVPEIGTIIGAQTSDASLVPRGWYYYNNKLELVLRIEKTIRQVFGDVRSRIGFSREAYVLQAPSFVARCINHIGIPYGNKTKQNYSLPKLLMYASLEMQKNYLSQRYSDEGSIRYIKDGRKRWFLFCYQAIDLNKYLTQKEFEALKSIVINNGKSKMTPSKTKLIVYSKISGLNRFKITTYKPNFLLDEQKLLKNFGIKSYLSLTKVNYYFKTKKLSAYWHSVIYDQDDVMKFYKFIKFNDSEKNSKLRRFAVERIHLS